MKRIRFKSNDYILVGDGADGAIATEEQYHNGLTSYAHLFPSGEVKRYGEVIGTIEDVEFLGDAELGEPNLLTFMRGFATDSNWDR